MIYFDSYRWWQEVLATRSYQCIPEYLFIYSPQEERWQTILCTFGDLRERGWINSFVAAILVNNWSLLHNRFPTFFIINSYFICSIISNKLTNNCKYCSCLCLSFSYYYEFIFFCYCSIYSRIKYHWQYFGTQWDRIEIIPKSFHKTFSAFFYFNSSSYRIIYIRFRKNYMKFIIIEFIIDIFVL